MRTDELANKRFYVMEQDRLESFKKWPFKASAPCSVAKMAEAGFFFCGNEREPDTAACFICDKTLDGWEAEDDPWEEHKRHAPQCAFVILGRPEKDLTCEEFLGLVSKVLQNIQIKRHAKFMKKVAQLCEKKREEIIKLYQS